MNLERRLCLIVLRRGARPGSDNFGMERHFGKDRDTVRRIRLLNAGKVDWMPSIMSERSPEPKTLTFEPMIHEKDLVVFPTYWM